MTPFSWNNPYAWPRKPLLAQNVVATSQPLAAQAGLQMLAAGGNAVDAILATAITLSLVEPVSNGIGSDAYALVWDGRKLHGLNASGRSPAAWTPDYFRGKQAMPVRGWDAITVPGAVSAWVEMHGKFGKLPFRRALRAGDPLRPRRLPGLADHRGTVAGAGRQAEGPARLRPGVPAGRTRAARGRKIRVQETCLGPGKNRRHQGQGILSRRACRKARGGGEEAGRRAARVRLGGAPARLGEAARDGLSRLHAARDPAQRPGNRGADRARHPRELRPALAPGRRRRQRAPADRGDEARLRRWLALRRRHRPHGRAPAGAARQGISEVEVEAHRSEARAGFRPRQSAERRHGVPHRGRRVRHDGLLHPVELHGLRLGRRGGRDLAAEPRQQLRARTGPSRTASDPASARTRPSFPASSRKTAGR